MLKRYFLCVAMLICVFALSACNAGVTRISLDGSTSMEKTVGFLGEAFAEKHPEISITYNPTGSSAGIEALRAGRCDIGVSTRYLTDDEKTGGLRETVIAYDLIAVVVNSENPLDNISMDELAEVFRGNITSWEAFGGSGEIVLIGRETGSGTRDGFEEATGTKDECKYRRELTSGGDVGAAVTENPLCIGYMSYASIPTGDKIKALSVDGYSADEYENGISGYKLLRPFIFAWRDGELSSAAKDFLSFALSDEGARYIKLSGVSPAAE